MAFSFTSGLSNSALTLIIISNSWVFLCSKGYNCSACTNGYNRPENLCTGASCQIGDCEILHYPLENGVTGW